MATELSNPDTLDENNKVASPSDVAAKAPAEDIVEIVKEEIKEEAKPVVEDVKPADPVIKADDPVKAEPSLKKVDADVIGVTTTEEKPKEKKAEVQKDKVALFSEKNVFWEGVGRVGKGYNIVDGESAKKWLKRNFIRLATPEEIKQEFGK
jgi:hypothetical protein